jgi:hypothetical protein
MDSRDGYSAGSPASERANEVRRPPLAGYANYFEIGHNAFEFLLDAGQVEPQSGEIRFTSRIAISPVHAKLLSELLTRSIEQFETAHDKIPEIADPEIDLPDLTCPEDFERRALDARRRANGAPTVDQER